VDRHLAPGYATTIHKTQGATFDRCLVLVDDALYREAAYSALSRGRAANHLFFVVEDERLDERHLPEDRRQPERSAASAFSRSERELTATELVGRQGQGRPYSPPLPPGPDVERGPSLGL
jgi:ATP-dependent exoDNAse (exonuclease V) alpha subunit